MPFSRVTVTSEDGTFVGYAIHNELAEARLQSLNLYAPSEVHELDQRLAELNETEALTKHWPDQYDTDVIALVQNPEFLPNHPAGGDPQSVFVRHNQASRQVARERANYTP